MKKSNIYYVNKETGEVLTYLEMLKDFDENYDGNDPTNPLEWWEYYDKVKLEIE